MGYCAQYCWAHIPGPPCTTQIPRSFKFPLNGTKYHLKNIYCFYNDSLL